MTGTTDDTTDSIGRLAGELDQSVVRAFIRREMWQFLLDMGWTAGAEPPPLRPGTTAAAAPGGGKVDAAARFRAESAQLQGDNTAQPTTDSSRDIRRTRAQQLREKLSVTSARHDG